MFSEFTFRGRGGLLKKINGLHFFQTLNFGRGPLWPFQHICWHYRLSVFFIFMAFSALLKIPPFGILINYENSEIPHFDIFGHFSNSDRFCRKFQIYRKLADFVYVCKLNGYTVWTMGDLHQEKGVQKKKKKKKKGGGWAKFKLEIRSGAGRMRRCVNCLT